MTGEASLLQGFASLLHLGSGSPPLFLEGTEPEVIFLVEEEASSSCRGVTIDSRRAPSTTSWSPFLG